MDGLQVRGVVVNLEHPTKAEGEQYEPFGRVTVEAKKASGEPYWERIAFTQRTQAGAETRVSEELRQVKLGMYVALSVEVKPTKAGSGTWTKALAVEVLDAPAKVDPAKNGAKVSA